MITRQTSTGEKIYIFDNVFHASKVIDHEIYANSCLFSLIKIAHPYVNSKPFSRFFGCILSDEDMNNFNILNHLPDQIKSLFNNKERTRSWILSGNHSTQYSYHVDFGDSSKQPITLLVYLNSLWHPEWGGETLFCNAYGDPEVAVAQKPNRVVVFPSNMDHKPSQITTEAPYRFTFTSTFINPSQDVRGT